MKNKILLTVITLISALTVSAQITTYPYSEGFEGGAAGWTTSGTLWEVGLPTATTINTANSGANAWATNLAGNYTNSANESVISPVFDFSLVPNPHLQLSIWWDSENSWDGTVLQSSIDNGSTWQNVGALGDPSNWFNDGTISGNPGGQQEGWTGVGAGWIQASHKLNGLGGQPNVQLRFSFGSDGSVSSYDGFAFDDILIYNVTCEQPAGLLVTNILDVSADLNWTAIGNAATYSVEWGIPGFAPGTGAELGSSASITSLTTNASGLTAATTYEFYVMTDCGTIDGVSTWAGPISFLTACSIMNLPWVDSIEAHTPTTSLTNSLCWDATATGAYDWNITGTGTTSSSNTGALSAYSGTNYFYTEASSGSIGDTAILLAPLVDVSSLTLPMIEFYYHMTGAQMGDLFVDVWDGTQWNVLATISGEQQTFQADPWRRKAVYVNGALPTLNFRFRAVGNGSFEGDICIDNISVLEAPTCPEPSDFALTGSDLTSASFSWNTNGSESNWIIEYGQTGFTQGTGSMWPTSFNPDTIQGLTPNTFYEAYLVALCGPGDTSYVIGPITFNTYNQGMYMMSDSLCPAAGYIDISTTGTQITTLTDDNEVGVSLPFPILFQNIQMNDITIGANVGVVLGTQNGNVGFGGDFTTLPDGTILPWGDDMHIGSGSVYYGTHGVSPNQVFIVQWDSVRNFSSPDSLNITLQIQFEESTNDIYFVYQDVVFGGSNSSDDYAGNADIGISGPNQDITISSNDTTYLQNNSCVHFYYTNCLIPLNAGDDGVLTACQNEQIDLSAGLSSNADAGGSWNDPSGSNVSSSVTVGGTPGLFIYQYIVSGNDCAEDTASIIVTIDAGCDALGVEDLIFNNISIYPNPTSGILNISNNNSIQAFNYEIISINGRIVLTSSTVINTTETVQVNLNNLESGIYMIRLFNENAEKTYRVVKH